MYKLESTLSGVKIIFEDDSSKTIYRKTFYETEWTEVATVSSKNYLDEVARSPREIQYRVDGVEVSILYTTINKLYELNIEPIIFETFELWDGDDSFGDGEGVFVIT